MTDPSDDDARLSPKEVDMIDSYFSRNYRQGERLDVPEECYKDGIKWKDRRLRELGFYNRIYHRKRDRIERPASYRPRVNLREGTRPNNPDVDLDPGHLEFKFWLQHRVELAAAGKGSPRMLQGIKGSTDDKTEAMEKWEELSVKIREGLNKRLLNADAQRFKQLRRDSRAPITALLVMDTADRHVRRYGHGMRIRAESEDLKDYLTAIMDPEDTTLESFGPIVSLCREVVYALFSNCRTKRPSDVEVFESRQISQLRKFAEENGIAVSDDVEKGEIAKKLHEKRIMPPGDWGWVKISLTSQNFLLTLSDRIADPDHMGKWIRTVQGLSKQDIRDLDLDPEEKVELRYLRNKGYFGRRGGKSDSAVKTQKDRDEKTLHNAKRLSYSIMMELVRLGILKKRIMDHEEYLEHSPEGRADKPVEGSYSTVLIFEPKLTDWTTKSDYAAFRRRDEHAIYRWLGGEGDRYMYAPPQDHDLTPAKKEPRPGGFLRRKNRKLIGGGHRDYEHFNTPRCRVSGLAVNALNTLQRVQWEVNLDFLVKVFDLSLAHDPPNVRDWTEIKKRITRVDCKEWAHDAFYGEDEAKNKERDIALMWTRKIINHNANVFWHSWACDFRGRLFPRGNGLSPHGDDLYRAMIRFKQWKPLGEEGRKWLFVHVHNMVAVPSGVIRWDEWGEDQPLKRQSFEDRDEWVSRNIDSLISLADSPRDHKEVLGLNEHSGTGSKTFQRLAALIELRRVCLGCKENGGDWSKVTSGQPVYLDASCNGYQHVSTLLRNRDLARHVNVVLWEDDPDHVTGDLYQAVANEAKSPESSGGVAARRKLLSELRGIMPDDKFLRRKVMGLLCTRDIAKPGTLTRMYGKDSTRDCFMGRRGKGKPGWFSSIKLEDESYGCPKPECDYTHQEQQYVRRHAKTKHHMRSCWHPESPLHLELLKPPVHSALEQKQYHTDLAIKVDNLFAAADYGVTGGAYRLYKDSVQSIARLATKTRSLRSIKTAKLEGKGKHIGKYKFHGKMYGKTVRLPEWEYAARWELPDKFEVINYYIKHAEASEGKRKNPTHPGSLYKHIIPEWYDPNSSKERESILARLEKLGVPELDKFRKAGQNYKKKLLEDIRKIALNRGGDAGLEEVLDTLSYDSVHLPRYEEDEKDRVWIAKPITSIAPNLIHSLDAFHMRTTIVELHKSDWNLDFWAVHDAFGTHACDVPAMCEKIRKGFSSLHHARDINWWLGKMTRDQMHESVYLQTPDKVRPYVYKDQLISHAKKNGIDPATVKSTAARDKHYSSMEEKQLHEVVYRKRLKDEIMEHTGKSRIDMESIESTAKRGDAPTKGDYITTLVKEQIVPPPEWLPVSNPTKSDYVDRLGAEGIAPPQEWVAWIDPSEFDKRLTFDARGSVYLVA